jgi:hypothetical protein
LRDRLSCRAAWPWWGLAAVLLMSCLLRASIADIPLERDEGEYGYISQRWAAGELPYQSSFNQKFPGAFLAYGAIRTCLGEGPAAIHWGLQLWSMGTVTLVFLLGRRLFSAPAGTAAAALAALMLGDYSLLGNAANAEAFAVLFFAASLLAAVHAVGRASLAWGLAAGAFGATGLLFKQTGLFSLGFVVLYVAWGSRRRALPAAATAAGAAVVLAVPLSYFVVNGAWEDFYDNTIGHNLSYAACVPLREYPAAFWVNFAPILKSFWPVGLLAVWGAIGPALRGRLAPARAGAEPQDPNWRPNGVLVVVWLAFCLLAVSAGGYFRQHYFVQAVPAAALLAGLGTTLVPPPWPAGNPGAARACILCGVLIYVILMAPWYYLPGSAEEKCRRLYEDNPFPESLDIGRFIAENSSADDAVLVMGSEPQVLYYARRRSATRYILAYPLTTPSAGAEARQKSVMEEVRRNEPRFVVTVFLASSFFASPEVTPVTIFGELRDYMAGRYALAGAVVRVRQPAGRPARLRFVTGDAVSQAFRASPMWYDTPGWWATTLVWRRLDSSASPTAGP